MYLKGNLNNLVGIENSKYWDLLVKFDGSEEFINERHQFEIDYAKALGIFLLQNVASLKPDDIAVLDLVPYRVWARVSAKARIIASAINQGLEIKNK